MAPASTPIDRRRALAGLGALGLGGVLAACSDDSSSGDPSSSTTTPTAGASAGDEVHALFDDSASCTLSPAQTEGPYYFDVDTIRSDIREDRDGTALRLVTRVLDASTCAPITDAVVDVWHCDASGIYSGFESASTGGANTRDDSTYLRGAQVTDAEGVAQFTTIYPGWYRGRTVHIHAKVHLDNRTLVTTQLYFPEEVNDAVAGVEPYRSDDGRDTTNATDGIFDEQMVMTLTADGDGYQAVMTINVQQ